MVTTRVQLFIISAFWTCIALFSAAQLSEIPNVQARNIPFYVLFARQWAIWGLWIPITLVVLYAGKRLQLTASPLQNWALHVLICLALAFIHLLIAGLLRLYLYPQHTVINEPWLQRMVRMYLLIDIIIYWGILGIGYAMEYYRLYQAREVQTAELKAELAQARMQALTMQLQPHFLFNALNSVVALVRKQENPAAVKMLVRLSDLLRYVLEKTSDDLVPLSQEIHFIEQYLAIEQVRFYDRLQIEYAIEPDTLEIEIPNLLLQPLVENAIKHGISGSITGGCIQIRAWKTPSHLHIVIRDNGLGLPADAATIEEGIGLHNTRSRLHHVYGEGADFHLTPCSDGGACATIRIAFTPLTINH